jgi:hypothetical protein
MRHAFAILLGCNVLACAAAPATSESSSAAIDISAPSPTAVPSAPAAASVGSSSTAAPPGALALQVDGESFRCPDDRCRGQLHYSGRVRFDRVEPATRARWGSQPEQALVDRGADAKDGRYELPAPRLDEVFAGRAPAELLLDAPDRTLAAVVALELFFPDGVLARGTVPVSGTAVRLAFLDRMKGVAKTPLTLPGDDAHTGAPRAMWVEFPQEVRGAAASVAELDWVLLFDDAPRPIVCERRKNGKREEETFQVQDVRGRVLERRTGRLVGEKTLPDPDALGCADFFQMRDQNVGGMVSQRDTTTPRRIADWAWGPLRAGMP